MDVGRRIVVVGSTGSGKTTLARRLARAVDVPHVELDALHWEPGWVEAETETLRRRVDAALRGDAWVVDGNYSKVRDITWGRADMVIWLDYPFGLTLGRLLRRTAERVVSGEELWPGSRETLRQAVSRDSIIVWLFRTYRKNRRQYTELLEASEAAHLRVLHVTRPEATERWLRGLEVGQGGEGEFGREVGMSCAGTDDEHGSGQGRGREPAER